MDGERREEVEEMRVGGRVWGVAGVAQTSVDVSCGCTNELESLRSERAATRATNEEMKKLRTRWKERRRQKGKRRERASVGGREEEQLERSRVAE